MEDLGSIGNDWGMWGNMGMLGGFILIWAIMSMFVDIAKNADAARSALGRGWRRIGQAGNIAHNAHAGKFSGGNFLQGGGFGNV